MPPGVGVLPTMALQAFDGLYDRTDATDAMQHPPSTQGDANVVWPADTALTEQGIA